MKMSHVCLCSLSLLFSGTANASTSNVKECLTKAIGSEKAMEVKIVVGAVNMQIQNACAADPEVAGRYAVEKAKYFQTDPSLSSALICAEEMRLDPNYAFLESVKDDGKSICVTTISKADR
jgi:hypothetical protein